VIVALCSWGLTLAFVVHALRAHLRLVLVARACHELRGPLFAVQLGLHGLAGDPARMSAIELELARAGRALDDLAAAPRGRRGESRSELVDLSALVTSYAPAWRALAEAYGARLRAVPVSPPAPIVDADPLRIAQACANLVGNAAEHGEGEIRVRVLAVGGVARIEVADDGPGLPASVPALTAHARARRGPRGHGLAIAAAIARDHGGRLFATGARIVLELPTVPGAQVGKPARESGQRTSPPEVLA
jgi:signal transduction histidine kinase